MTAETHDHLDTSENMAPDRAKVPYRARTVTMRARELRVMGAGMLAVAAVRPLIPIETGPPLPVALNYRNTLPTVWHDPRGNRSSAR